MAYLYIICSAACSVLIAHLLKVTEVKNLRTLPTLTINYLFAGAVAFIIGMQQGGRLHFLYNAGILVFGLVVGALFIGNFLIYSKSVNLNGVGVTIAAMRVSLLIPVLISLYVYSEHLSWPTAVGIALVMGALVLLVPKTNAIRIGKMHAGWLLVLIFLIAGFADASLKIYQEELSTQFNELLFMSLVFSGAFAIGIVAMMLRGQSLFTAKETGMGCLIGIPNLYSSVFLLYALHSMDGTVAYSMVNALNVAAGTALGLLWWKDQITNWQWAGLGLAVVAIIFLL